ncbi:glycoside hydrolase family 65 protein [Neobacillus notoginsengisoli]|uniref:Glycoside hydrolase family 65 protein n=1 Tax=Neobacillus notoginsengisoli TaxID=1578198 RepID=A0A417YW80_9BACI|nr:glycosyl hydrolase family 65 protein [Neobacillus notoginsengisoli]RHW41615.1 glycoside hydrolase family 65 protein [Neobacillus notoginsengisoli]
MSWKINSYLLQENQLLNEESLFFTGNGYLGVRGNFEEGLPIDYASIRGTYINAFHDIVPIEYGEKLYGFPETQQKLLNVIDAQTINIKLGDEGFSLFEGEAISYSRTLHLDKGYTERSVHWRSPGGKEVKIKFLRLASFKQKELFMQKVVIEPVNYRGEITIVSTVNGDVTNFTDKNDPRVSSGHARRLNLNKAFQQEGLSYVEVEALESKLKAACGTVHSISQKTAREVQVKGGRVEFSFHGSITDPIVFEKKSVYVDTIRHGEELLSSVEEIQSHLSTIDFDEALKEQEAFLAAYWLDTDIQIEGDPGLQEGIRFNLYHLLQSAGRDRVSNIAAKGLSGEGYEGHYFWDTEIYMIPVFLLSNPEIAKQLLLYRYSILDGAREHAKIMGHKKGALYPWRTISGSECSSYYPSGSAQYHISADIAYSYIQYYLVTGDIEFLKEVGAEVLFETARIWIETGHFKDGTFRIDAVTGPDEYTCVVNNNYYTNVMAKHNLKWASKTYKLFSDSEPGIVEEWNKTLGLEKAEVEEWLRAASQMYLPYEPELDINPQDDTFLNKQKWDLQSTPEEKFPLLLHFHPLTLYRYQVCKQADTILAHFLLEDEQDSETMKNSYDYYETITTHDSSLSSCVFSIMAAKHGYKEKAYDYFIETARLDLDNTHGNTKDGLHMANMGGTWMAIIFGFAGLRIKEEGLSLNPVLPARWEGYSFPLRYQGRKLRISITKADTKVELLSGEKIDIVLSGKNYCLVKGESTIVTSPVY